MTSPPPRYLPCRCTHQKAQHEGPLAPQCHADRCECLQYRPSFPGEARARLQPPLPASLRRQALTPAEVVDLPEAPADVAANQCPECGKKPLSNVGSHRARAHGFRRGVAS